MSRRQKRWGMSTGRQPSASAEAEKVAKDVAAALVRKLELTAKLAELELRTARLHAIALDLRSDAIVDFLQAQALEGLALEGSARLRV